MPMRPERKPLAARYVRGNERIDCMEAQRIRLPLSVLEQQTGFALQLFPPTPMTEIGEQLMPMGTSTPTSQ
jgi:hypothetical protein